MYSPVTITRQLSTVDRGRRREEDGEDEEQSEIWAALERLPTYDRLRKTVLETSKREHRQVDLSDVNLPQYVVNKLFKLNNPNVDNEIFLTKLTNRIAQVGIEIPKVEVRYENLTVRGKVHVGTRGLPTLYNTALNFIESILSAVHLSPTNKRDITILDGVSGILKPGRMTLLLGPPGAGKTVLLVALAGMLDPNLHLQGTITYNGNKLDEFQPRKTAAYISQNDLHMPELTVRETMGFSARYQGTGARHDLITDLLRKEKELGIRPDPDLDIFMKASIDENLAHELVTEYMMKIMGLDICADTIVGDQMRRGISGGQRKRLTTGEMTVGPSRALFMDEISTGLDSSTTFSVVKCVGQFARFTKTTILMSLLQAAPETYALFDDVILLAAGLLVYHGPRESVEEFFESCGFRCPPRKNTADFLQEVTSKNDQEQYWADKSKPYQFVPVKQFADAFKKSRFGQKISEELATPSGRTEIDNQALVYTRWLLPKWDLFKITFEKECLLIRRNMVIPIFNCIMLTTSGLILSSLFFRTRMHHRNLADAQRYAGAVFFVLNTVVFVGYGEIVATASRMQVFQKFRELQFFPPWTWVLSAYILKIPFSIVESFVLLLSTYYLIGFAPAASRFFRLWFLLALADQMGSGLFRMLAGFCKTLVVSSSIGGFGLIVLFTLGGYVIPRTDIKPWWIWGYWTSPLSYVQNGVLVNEYLAPQWRKDLPNDEHTLGARFIMNSGQFARGFWYWLACGVLFVYGIVFYLLFAWSVTYLPAPQKSRALVSEEQLKDMEVNRTGEAPQTSTKQISLPRSASSSPQSGESPTKNSEISSAGRHETRSSAISVPGTKLSMRAFGKRGMILPFQPLAMTFKDVNYYVDLPAQQALNVKEDKLQLLREITGTFRPGVLTALMGVTGAGKSTLMDVLSGRKTKGYVEGDIRISGFPKKQDTFARIAGYCEQNDIHSPQVTVHESLIFSAWLRLPRDILPDMKREFVQEVLDLVELTPLQDALVGIPGETGLSTEQRKRLTIAVELVANPSIVFMDEPTSGLDARAAATVMRAVRNAVDTGRTVVCTIHQPSMDIFESFDELLLLKRGGEIIYAGPLGQRSRLLIKYFEAIEGVPPIKESENPAAWMLEATTPGMEEKLGVDFAEIYRNSSLYSENHALVEELSTPSPNAEDISFDAKYAQPIWTQFTCCYWKQFWAYWRNPDYNLMRLLLSIGSAFFFGTVFWGIGKKLGKQRNLYTLMGAIYTGQSFYGVLTASAVQPVIHSERTVLYRERSAGMYSEIPYAFALCLVELPYILTSSTGFSIISFAMIQLDWKVEKFFWYLFFTFFSQLTYAYWGMTTVALTPNPATGAILAGIFYNLWGLFNGFIISRPKFPVWWRWAYWCDPLSYVLYGTLVSQFGDLSDVYSTSVTGERTSVKNVLKSSYGYKHSFLWFIALMTVVWPFLLAVMFILSMKFLNYQQR